MANNWLENVGTLRFVDHHQCIWMAPYNLMCDPASYVTSPMFSLDGRKLRLAKLQYMLYLWNENRNPPYDECNVTLAIGCTNRQRSWSCEGETNLYYGFGKELPVHNYSGRLHFIDAKTHNGCIEIFCKVEKKESKPPEEDPLSNETANKIDNSSNIEEEDEVEEMKVKGVERLALNLKNLLTEGHNSDVILKAESREFRVHKGILGARSLVFASMFQLDMKEKTSGLVDIPDCTAESFEVFLLYLYTGVAETMSSENVSNLYYAADKYRVDDLKEDCVQFMKDNMSVENICDVVALSLRHSETGLLKEATNFFRKNIKKIIKTVKWQIYLQENSTHANELLVKALDA